MALLEGGRGAAEVIAGREGIFASLSSPERLLTAAT
jgi:hypothetical protein